MIFLPTLCYGEQTINFFVQTYPTLIREEAAEELVSNALDPQAAISRILKTNPTSYPFAGLFATYAGYITVSAPFSGQISFPRKQKDPFFYLVITPTITPIIMIGATIHHWELVEGLPVESYIVSRKQDQDTKNYFWAVSKSEIPEKKIVPLSSIVIFAKPENIYVPIGITPTNNNPQLLLPTIYVKDDIDMARNALRTLNFKHFFRSIQHSYKKGTPQSTLSQINY
jgi:hypothetical protein